MTPPPGRLDFSVAFQRGERPARGDEVGVGHLLFVARYSRPGAAPEPGALPAPRRLRVEELAMDFRSLAVAIEIAPLMEGGAPFRYAPREPEELHPEGLLRRIPALAALWEPLQQLDADSRAVERLRERLGEAAAVTTAASAEPTGVSAASGGSAAGGAEEGGDALLSRLLGTRAPGVEAVAAGGRPSAAELVQRLAERASAGAQVVASPEREALRAAAGVELGRRLRALLRQPGFRQAATSWQATERVVRSCPDDTRTHFSVLDAGWEQLAGAPEQLEALLGRQGVSVLVIDHCFGTDAEELRGLCSLVRLCAARGVFLVTGATAALAGCERFATEPEPARWASLDDWQSDWSEAAQAAWAELGPLREAGAQFALVLPRCLVRQPFGKRGERLDGFEFEELEARPGLDAFDWANGAYLAARALMEQWCAGKADLAESHELGGLPVITVPDGDGLALQPPVEATLSEAAVQRLLDQGFSVIELARNSDRARVHL